MVPSVTPGIKGLKSQYRVHTLVFVPRFIDCSTAMSVKTQLNLEYGYGITYESLSNKPRVGPDESSGGTSYQGNSLFPVKNTLNTDIFKHFVMSGIRLRLKLS